MQKLRREGENQPKSISAVQIVLVKTLVAQKAQILIECERPFVCDFRFKHNLISMFKHHLMNHFADQTRAYAQLAMLLIYS